MRQREAEIRATLERTHKAARELADRMHYDQLAKQCDERLRVLLEELPKLLERRIEALGDCFSANQEVRHECEDLQRQLDLREGRPPKPDLLEQIESILSTLPKELQDLAERMRLRIALGTALRKPVQVAPDVFEKASAYVASAEAHVAAMRREMNYCIEIHAEKVRRGWAPRESFDAGRKGMEENLLKIEGGVTPLRDTLRQWSSEHETLKQQRQDLLQALGQGRGDSQ